MIARFGASQQPRLWQPEPSEIRTLKALIARYEAVCQDIQREENGRYCRHTAQPGYQSTISAAIEKW